MTERDRLNRLANLLYGLAIVLFIGTFLELLAAKHFQEPMQLVPVVLCIVGAALVALAWKQPSREIIQGMRGAMVVIAAASILGVWKHIEGNVGFVQEMHPDSSGTALLVGALTGRAPLLASGALAVTGVVALLATVAAGWSWRGEDLPELAPADPGPVGTAVPAP